MHNFNIETMTEHSCESCHEEGQEQEKSCGDDCSCGNYQETCCQGGDCSSAV